MPRATRGRASLIVLLAAALVVVVAAVWIARRSDRPLVPSVAPDTAAPAKPAPAAADLAPPVEPATAARTGDATPTGEPSSSSAAPGGPRLRIEIVDEGGVPVSGDFEFEIRLNLNLQNGLARGEPVRTQAHGPRVDLPVDTGAETLQLVLADPPSAHVIARRLGERGEGVVPLARPGDSAWTRFVVRATTVVRGSLVDGAGNPLEGVAVMLRDNTPGRAPHSTAVTDAAGSFAIDLLPGVRNRLFVGDERYPWVPVQDLEPGPGPRRLEPIRVELFAATFRVQRPDGSPAEGAQLEGIGLDGGRFAAKADADGLARVATLLRGRWRVNAAEATHGRGSRAVEIPLEKDEPVLILLPR